MISGAEKLQSQPQELQELQKQPKRLQKLQEQPKKAGQGVSEPGPFSCRPQLALQLGAFDTIWAYQEKQALGASCQPLFIMLTLLRSRLKARSTD